MIHIGLFCGIQLSVSSEPATKQDLADAVQQVTQNLTDAVRQVTEKTSQDIAEAVRQVNDTLTEGFAIPKLNC